MKLKELSEANTLFKGTSIEKHFGQQKATIPQQGSKKRVLDGATVDDTHHKSRPDQQGTPKKAVPYSHPSSAHDNSSAQSTNYNSHILK